MSAAALADGTEEAEATTAMELTEAPAAACDDREVVAAVAVAAVAEDEDAGAGEPKEGPETSASFRICLCLGSALFQSMDLFLHAFAADSR